MTLILKFLSYDKGRKLKRKRGNDDEGDVEPNVKRYREKEVSNTGMKIKPYDRNERRIKRGKVKKAKI